MLSELSSITKLNDDNFSSNEFEQASIPPNLAGKRLDKALVSLFPAYSRNRLQQWLKQGRILINTCRAEPDQSATEGAQVELHPELEPIQRAFMPQKINFKIIEETPSILIIDKPAGLVVHPAPGNWEGTLLNGLLYQYPNNALHLPRAGIIHRLDKDTSGLLVVARTLAAQTKLTQQMQTRSIKRRYLAFVWGILPAKGTIDAPIGRDPIQRCRMAILPTGRLAKTHFCSLGIGSWEGRPVSLLRCDLETGRTHQIRVHLESIGHPLIGDTVYSRTHFKQMENLKITSFPIKYPLIKETNNSYKNLPSQKKQTCQIKTNSINISRQALHAWQLGLHNPSTSEWCEWQANPPEDLQMLAKVLNISLP